MRDWVKRNWVMALCMAVMVAAFWYGRLVERTETVDKVSANTLTSSGQTAHAEQAQPQVWTQAEAQKAQSVLNAWAQKPAEQPTGVGGDPVYEFLHSPELWKAVEQHCRALHDGRLKCDAEAK